jgi:hypothetical protein
MSVPDADLAEIATALRNEALALVAQSGLGDVLTARFGSCEVVGSAALDLMTWRDIDVYVEVARDEPQRFIDALPPIYAAFASAGHTIFRLTFNDEWHRPRGDYGQGFYFGLRVATAAGVVWKVDLWGWDRETYARKIQEHAQLEQALRTADRPRILQLKHEAQDLPGFRDTITSHDIYQFVLAGAGDTLEQLSAFCAARRSGVRQQ